MSVTDHSRKSLVASLFLVASLLVLSVDSALAFDPSVDIWVKYNNTQPPRSNGISNFGQIPSGTVTMGDSLYIISASVINDGGTYKMWYAGFVGISPGHARIYYATSPDGLTWTKYNNIKPPNSDTTSSDGRIPRGTSGKGDDAKVSDPTVINDGGTYKM